jgi:hypothetical protein
MLRCACQVNGNTASSSATVQGDPFQGVCESKSLLNPVPRAEQSRELKAEPLFPFRPSGPGS